MASLRELQSKAKKLLAGWRKEHAAGILKRDERSPLSHLCMTILMRNNSYRNARQACDALAARFADWNEIRVSPVAEVVDVFEPVGVPNAEQKAYALRRFLRDVYAKFTKTNMNFDLIRIPEGLGAEKGDSAGEKGSGGAGDDDEEGDEPVSRESGLPSHPEIPGFVDGEKILAAPIPLDPKIITEKNTQNIAIIALDDAERAPFNALWRVVLCAGLVEPELGSTEALMRVRQVAPEKEVPAFCFFGLLEAEENWAEVSKKFESVRAKYAPDTEDEDSGEDDEIDENKPARKAKARK